MRTWQSFLVRYEEQPYKKGLNKLAVFHGADNSFLGDVIPDNADHLQNIIDALEKGICPVMEGWDVGNGKRGTLDGWTDEALENELMATFAGTSLLPVARAISQQAYEETIKNHARVSFGEDYPLTFKEFLIVMLSQSGRMKDADYFEDAHQARKEGFYWLDQCNKWIRYINE